MAEHPELKTKEGRRQFLGMKMLEPKSLEKQQLTASQIISDNSEKSGSFDIQSGQTEAISQPRNHQTLQAQQTDLENQVSTSERQQSKKKTKSLQLKKLVLDSVLVILALIFGFPALVLFKLPLSYNQKFAVLITMTISILLSASAKFILGKTIISPLQLIF